MMKKNILEENMRRFNTKNLNEDHPGILFNALKAAKAVAGGLVAGVIMYSKMYSGKTNAEQKQIRMVSSIQNMIMKDTDPAVILKYMKSQDPSIDDATGITILKILGQQMGVYVDTENPDDTTPLT